MRKDRKLSKLEEEHTMIVRGNKIHVNWKIGKYISDSTGEIINDDYSNLKCPNCNKPPTPEEYDACLGHLKGIRFACCGHGGRSEKYVMLDDRTCLYEDEVDFNLYK